MRNAQRCEINNGVGVIQSVWAQWEGEGRAQLVWVQIVIVNVCLAYSEEPSLGLHSHFAAVWEHQSKTIPQQDQGKAGNTPRSYWTPRLPFVCVMFYNQGLPSLEQMVHCQVQVALLSVPSRLPFAIVLLQPSLLRLAGFIHHSGQVYTPRPRARTANKLPWHVDCLPYLTPKASRALLHIVRNTSNYCTGLSGTVSWCSYSAPYDLGCLSDGSFELWLHPS